MEDIYNDEQYNCNSGDDDKLEVGYTDIDGYECVSFLIRNGRGHRDGVVHVDPKELDRMIGHLNKIKRYLDDKSKTK